MAAVNGSSPSVPWISKVVSVKTHGVALRQQLPRIKLTRTVSCGVRSFLYQYQR
jgi:hypothetical protein